MTAPACVTVAETPAIVSVAARLVSAVFAATCAESVPVPLPVCPVGNVTHAWFDDAVHEHPVVVATLNVSVAPAAATLLLVGVSVNAHCAASCVIENVFAAIVNVVVRRAVDVFGATE
jgi:hypothetical protein